MHIERYKKLKIILHSKKDKEIHFSISLNYNSYINFFLG